MSYTEHLTQLGGKTDQDESHQDGGIAQKIRGNWSSPPCYRQLTAQVAAVRQEVSSAQKGPFGFSLRR